MSQKPKRGIGLPQPPQLRVKFAPDLMLHSGPRICFRGAKHAPAIHEPEFHSFAFLYWALIEGENHRLTFAARHCTLLMSCCKSQLAPPIPRRMLRATSASSRILCADSLQFRTPKSRRNSTPKNEQRRGRLRGLPPPALLPKRVRGSFLPPCQSPPQRLTASPRSAIKLGGICPRRSADFLSSNDC